MNSTQILIVEDQPQIAEWLQNTLQGFGFDVPYIAYSGEQAIELVNRSKPDLVLMDINFEVPSNHGKIPMDGIQTAEKLFNEFNLPILYITGSTDIETIDRASLTGAYGYLVKPIDPNELKTTIDLVLKKYRLYQSEKQKDIERAKVFVDGQENERIRISSELHEEIGTILSVLSQDLSKIEDFSRLKGDSAETRLKISSVRSQINSVIQAIKVISSELMPVTLINLGLYPALNRYIKDVIQKKEIKIDLFGEDLLELGDKIDTSVQLCIYRIVVELVDSIIKHSHSAKISISFCNFGSYLEIIVEDDGVGFNILNNNLGFMSIQTRLSILNGTIQIESIPSKVSVTQNDSFYKDGMANYITIKLPINTENDI